MFFQSEIAWAQAGGGGRGCRQFWFNANSLKSGNALIASLFSLSLSVSFFSVILVAGLVSKSTRQIPQTGEATAEGAGTVCDPLVQRHDAEHTGLQCLTRLSAISASQHHESLSPGKHSISLSLPVSFHHTQFSWSVLPLTGSVPNGRLLVSGHDAAILHGAQHEYGIGGRASGLDG